MINKLEKMVEGTTVKVKKGVVKFLDNKVGEVIKAENINCVYVMIEGTQYKLYAEDLEIVVVEKALTVEEVKEYAMERYEEGGDCIIECWEDEYIQEHIDEGYTLKDFKEIMDMHKERWSAERRLW